MCLVSKEPVIGCFKTLYQINLRLPSHGLNKPGIQTFLPGTLRFVRIKPDMSPIPSNLLESHGQFLDAQVLANTKVDMV